MLTGNNSAGKTSVLEGLYCLFSATRLDVSPLSRYDRGIAVSNSSNLRKTYNYKRFWDECPYYGHDECIIEAKANDASKWEWSYKKANLSDIHQSTIPQEIIKNSNMPIDGRTQFALFNWRDISKQNVVGESFPCAQVLTPDGDLYFISDIPQGKSISYYIDFSNLRLLVSDLPFDLAKKIVFALQIINPQVTDIRLKGIGSGFSVVLNNETEISLETLGNGSVSWVSALLSFLKIAEFVDAIDKEGDMTHPAIMLVDEMGTGIHYSSMLNIWKYIKGFREQNPNIQFVFTSHSDDCIRAYCDVFSDSDIAKIVRLHQRVDDVIVPTYYNKEDFESIAAGNWEVRG